MKPLTIIVRLILGILIALMLIPVSHRASVTAHDEVQNIIDAQPSYVLSSTPVRFAALGFDNLAADIVWMRAVQYMGEHYRDTRFSHLAELLETVVSLDPKFSAAYKIALLLLPDADRIDAALELGHRGIQNIPDDPEIPYYLAYNYFQYKKDYASAAQWFEYAAQQPNALPSAQTLAATNLEQVSSFEVAREIWQNLYDTSADPGIQEHARQKVIRFDNLLILQSRIDQYTARYGTMPTSLQEIVQRGLITSIPDDPIEKMMYVMNTATGLPEVIRRP